MAGGALECQTSGQGLVAGGHLVPVVEGRSFAGLVAAHGLGLDVGLGGDDQGGHLIR